MVTLKVKLPKRVADDLQEFCDAEGVGIGYIITEALGDFLENDYSEDIIDEEPEVTLDEDN